MQAVKLSKVHRTITTTGGVFSVVVIPEVTFFLSSLCLSILAFSRFPANSPLLPSSFSLSFFSDQVLSSKENEMFSSPP